MKKKEIVKIPCEVMCTSLAIEFCVMKVKLIACHVCFWDSRTLGLKITGNQLGSLFLAQSANAIFSFKEDLFLPCFSKGV